MAGMNLEREFDKFNHLNIMLSDCAAYTLT